MMEIITLKQGSIPANCYLVGACDECCVIDPSVDATMILEEAHKHGWKLKYILATHCHFDHLLTVDNLRKKTGMPLWVHESEFDFPGDGEKNASVTFYEEPKTFLPPDRTYTDGFVFPIGNDSLTVVHTPGHTVGSSCFFGEGFCICGDTLFEKGGYGRTDLYSGDFHAICRSIQKLSAMLHEETVCPGHGNAFRWDKRKE